MCAYMYVCIYKYTYTCTHTYLHMYIERGLNDYPHHFKVYFAIGALGARGHNIGNM